MIAWIAAIATGLGIGFVSGVFPLVNAEVAAAAFALQLDGALAWAAVIALALGQTGGKVLVYEAARGGRALSRRWQRRHRTAGPGLAEAELAGPEVAGAELPGEGPSQSGRALDGTRARFREWWTAAQDKLVAAMDRRWPAVGVVALSAVVSLPPLLVTAVAAGLLKMHRLDFVICVACGRIIRLGAIAWPLLVLV
ncbi:MAG: hypothetical protein LBE08_04740 [Bifidobacteriaceae bacterium]|jgi:membrane protein YqaA with SNARE-associated domain|nr:hypothetical protein [Bifidobacteriaceae bacterium]